VEERKIDIEKLTEEQFEAAVQAVGKKVNEKVDAVCEEANKLLKRYGLSCKMHVVIDTEENFNDPSRYNNNE
jgi:hypothetical protein